MRTLIEEISYMAKSSHRVQNRVAIVTGAGKGIGQACAIAFAKLGAGVILNGRGVNAGGSIQVS